MKQLPPMRKRQEIWLYRIVIGSAVAQWAFFVWWAFGGSVPAGVR